MVHPSGRGGSSSSFTTQGDVRLVFVLRCSCAKAAILFYSRVRRATSLVRASTRVSANMAPIRTPCSMLREWTGKTKRRQSIYAFFVLTCLTVIYLANQMDRFLLGVVSKRLSRDLVFGSKGCLPAGISGSRVNDSCASHICNAIDNETR